MTKVAAFIQFHPLEAYPPIMNVLGYFSSQNPPYRSLVITTFYGDRSINEFDLKDPKFKVLRYGRFWRGQGLAGRLLNYLVFYVSCLLKLVVKRPSCIVYFDTLSSFPAYLYKRFVNPNASIFIHYHEYVSPKEYDNGMVLVKYFHRKERFLYKRAKWVSHTNGERLKMFLANENLQADEKFKVMPNFPPAKWSIAVEREIRQSPLKFVYVGALDLQTMYVKEFADWVRCFDGDVIWDIYSNNISSAVISTLQTPGCKRIRVMKAINYSDLPGIMNSYDIGVILYKGHIPNFIFNAPNKLFEYLACGLDVWYPSVMVGIYAYQTIGVYPKVCRIDFEMLSDIDPTKLINRQGLKFEPSKYFCEKVYSSLYEKIGEVLI